MATSKKNVLVTGGCGAIGINLVNRLVDEGQYNVHVIDNLSSGQNPLPQGVGFSCIDVGNKEKLEHFFDDFQPHVIYHLAAHFANQNSVDHPVSDTDTNVIGVINLLQLQIDNKQLEKFVFASSSCVYGTSEFMSEDDVVRPYDTPYAINKYTGEMYCRYYAEIHKVPTVCARIFNSFGPGEMPGAYRNVIPNFVHKALKNEVLKITGTGDETRDFTFVDNTVDLLCRLAQAQYHMGEVFNSGTGVGLSIKTLAETIIEVVGSQSPIEYTEARSWDHIKHRRSNIEKSGTLLGYEPKPNIRQEIALTADWVRSKLGL